jgi:outer membrane lipoprotein SlyB
MQEVTIEGNTEMAQGMGAAVGGYAGNRSAKNESELVEIAATVAGAAVGNMAGDVASKTIMSTPGTELMVYIDGTTHSIVQETDVRQPYAVGDDVWVIGNLRSAPQSNSQWNRRYGKQSNTGCKSGVRVLIKR